LKAMASLEGIARIRNTSIALSDSIVEMTGSVPSKQLKSEILAAIESGVSAVDIPVAARLGVRAVTPELDMWMADDSTLLVQGLLDAKSKEALTVTIRANLGNRRMVETIATDADAVAPEWIESVKTMIPDFLTNVVPEQLKVKDGEVVLRGATGTQQIAGAFEGFIERAFPTSAYSVTNELKVTEGLGLENAESSMGLSAEQSPESGDSLFDVLSDSTIYFRSGSTGLGSGDKRKLRNLASVIQRDGAAKIEIVGHCDPSGDAALNTALAKRRCQGVHNYLVEQGIPEDRFVVNPIGSNGKTGGRSSKQRRVDFRISSGLLSQATEAIPQVSQANPTMKPIALDSDEGARLVQVTAYAGATKVYFATAKIHRQPRTP
jgi:outer membrane protein OmpA-like peptidoglycan-associated protein